ncbi:MAG: uncharacterized protein QG652_1771 [Pseudomonadota bacterium]|nr:uncharacterized protein [Pseudomonadota bacterium]
MRKLIVIPFILFNVMMLIPSMSQAEMAIVFSDVSAGVFRFQIKLAEQGNAEAQYKVGEMYETGKGADKNIDQARDWYGKAAKQGHKKAEYKLLYLDISANGLTDASKNQMTALRNEAAGNNPDAQYFLGKMYASGVGVPKSLDDALVWLNKAAFNGVPEAEHEAIAVDEELARIREREAKRRVEAAEETRKQKEAEDLARKEKEARERELVTRREAEKAAAARKEAERKAEQEKMASGQNEKAEKERLEKEKQEREKAEAAAMQKQEQEEAKKATFESDPCKGKSARFLSTCR